MDTATRPLRWGGLGIRRLQTIGAAARLGSWAATLPILTRLAPELRTVIRQAEREISTALGSDPSDCPGPFEPPPCILPPALAELVQDVQEVRGQLATARAAVEEVNAALDPDLAPDVNRACRQALQGWLELSPDLFFGSPPKGSYLQHRILSRLEGADGLSATFGPRAVCPQTAKEADDTIRRLSASGVEGGLWLDQHPESNMVLENKGFSIALRLRLGMEPVAGGLRPWRCTCCKNIQHLATPTRTLTH